MKWLFLLLFSVAPAPSQLLEDWIKQIVGTNLVTSNAALINSSFSGLFRSTNAYSVTYGIGDASGHGQQIWHQLYTGDTNAPPFTFTTSVASNNFNSAVNNPSPFQGLNDAQLHYGYNIPGTPGYRPDKPTWVRGFESGWFNPYRGARIEVYDRVILPNGSLSGNDVGFGYEVELETGSVEAAISSSTLQFRNPYTTLEWMRAEVDQTGKGVLNISNGYISSTSTNPWAFSINGVGFFGRDGGKNYFLASGGSDQVTFFKGANEHGSELKITLGYPNGISFRWTGNTTSDKHWEFQMSNGSWIRIKDWTATIADLQARVAALESVSARSINRK